MQKTLLAVSIAALVAVFSATCEPVAARPQYSEAYKRRHANDAAAVSRKCALCHVGQPPLKKWTDYGLVFGDALGGKNVRDFDAIYRAIDKADGGAPGLVSGAH